MADEIYVGGAAYLVCRPESTYGTYNSGGSDDKRILVTNVNPTMKNNSIRIFGLGGGRNYVQVVPGKYEISGSYDLSVQNAKHLMYVFGTISAGTTCTKDFDGVTITGTPTAALKSYGILEATNLASFTGDLRYLVSSVNDLQHRMTGMKINQMSLKCDTDNEIKATMDFVAQTSTTTVGTLATPTTTSYSDKPYMFYQGKIMLGSGDFGTGTGASGTMTDTSKSWTTNQWGTNYVVIDSNGTSFAIASNTATILTVTGTPATGEYTISPMTSYTASQLIYCNSMNLTLTNNLESYWSISNDTGRGLRFAIEKQREYSLDLDLILTNAEQIARLYDGTTSATTPTTSSNYSLMTLVADFRTASNIGDATKAIRFVINDIIFDENSIPTDPKEMVKQTVKAFAKKCSVYSITSETQ